MRLHHPRHATAVFELRDDDLPDRPPLAVARDLTGAVAELDRLNAQFRGHLERNGEGGTLATLRLRIDECEPGQPSRVRWLSAIGGP